MNLIGTKNIETERCKLRRIIPDDYSMMYENWLSSMKFANTIHLILLMMLRYIKRKLSDGRRIMNRVHIFIG